MCGFDKYIHTVTDGLRINGKKKGELVDEFLDHLELLKSEYLQNGFSESESVEKAIERFGEGRDIHMKLQKSCGGYRTLFNILFGALITLVLITLCYLPMTGLTIAYNQFQSASDISEAWLFDLRYIVNCVLFFIPFGYFLPIILKRVYKVYHWIFIFSILGLVAGMCFTIGIVGMINFTVLMAGFAVGFVGSMAGYGILIAVDRLRMLRKQDKAAVSS